MTNKQILQADMLDILFEHRNKLYGAYALRKTYSKRLGVALATALSVVFLFVVMSFIKKERRGNGKIESDTSVILTDVNLDKEEVKEPEKPKEQPKSKNAEIDYQKIVVVPDDKADPIPTTDELKDADISDKNKPGDIPDGTAKPSEEANGDSNDPNPSKEEANVPELPSHPPEFPGGTQAWLAFLQRYLQSPDDIEPGKRIEVQVRFWVDTDGNVSKPEIVKSGGAAFDKEVLRVMKKMPKWEPAIQNGNHIAVAYTQPVIFVGVEE